MPWLQELENKMLTLVLRLQKTTALIISFLLLVGITAYSASVAEAGDFNHTKWRQYDTIVQQVSRKYQIDPRLIHAVIWQESSYNRRAVSSAAAKGLMQIMPGTARDLGVQRPFSARENIDGGTRYLITQLRRFGSVKKALQAYNCGPERVAMGRVPNISLRYANQVIARFQHIKRTLPRATYRHHPTYLAQRN